jgi:hypothetical protein
VSAGCVFSFAAHILNSCDFFKPYLPFFHGQTNFDEKPSEKIEGLCVICGKTQKFKLGESANVLKHLNSHPEYTEWKKMYDNHSGKIVDGESIFCR